MLIDSNLADELNTNGLPEVDQKWILEMKNSSPINLIKGIIAFRKSLKLGNQTDRLKWTLQMFWLGLELDIDDNKELKKALDTTLDHLNN